MAYSRVEAQLAEEARARMLSGKKDPEKNFSQGSQKKRNPQTSEVVARKIGVSRPTYESMKQIVSEGTKEQIERMDKGGFDNIDVLLIDDIHFITAHKNTRSNNI